jgi:anti-anti-sigma factor
MTEIIKEGGKTIIKTDKRIDTMNAAQFEKDIEPALQEQGMDLEMDCTELNYMASSGLRIIQKTMRTVMMKRGKFKMTNVSPEIYKVLAMTGFTKFMPIEKKE